MKAHVCIDCRALAEKSVTDGGLEVAPKTPRPAPHGGPRTRRCTTHQRALKRRLRQTAREKRSEKVYGLEPGVRAQLMELQDGKCPICLCGLDMDARGRFRRTAHDHDHDLAAQHDHELNEACEECMRGLTCNWCNGELMSRIDLEAARRLVAYYEHPPMARLRASRQLQEPA